MAKQTIKWKVTAPLSITAPDDLTIDKKGSVVISFKGEYDAEEMAEYAIRSTANKTTANTFVLNGPISITDKTTDPEGATASHMTCGLKFEQTSTDGGTLYTATIETDKASTIKVTRTTDTVKTANVYGILATSKNDSNPIELVFDGEQYLDAITVSTTNTNKVNGGAINAYAIRGTYNITFKGDLAAALSTTSTSSGTGDIAAAGITASKKLAIDGDITKTVTAKAENKNKESGKATAYGIKGETTAIGGKVAGAVKVTANSKAGTAYAYGFYNSKGNLSINDGISKDISVTSKADSKTATAAGIYVQMGNFTIGTEDNEADLAGNITVKGTGAKRTTTYGIMASNGIVICGDITKAITATAENKSKETGAATAYGINSGNGLSLDGTIFGAIKVTATAKADTATAYAISTVTSVGISEGIAKAITATAKGSATNEAATEIKAAGINAASILSISRVDNTVNAIAGAITAQATGNAALNVLGTEVYAGNATAIGMTASKVIIFGNISKTISATATANSAKDADGAAFSGTATAYAIKAEESITINGTVSAALKATATSKTNAAAAYVLYSGTTMSITGGITKDITATVTGSANESTLDWGDTIVAAGIYSKGAVTIKGVEDKKGNVNAITGNISVKGTANAYLKEDGSVAIGNSSVSGICVVGKDLTIKGNITKNITATATANGVKDASKTLVSGSANAWGIYASGENIEFEGDITGKITATATSKSTGAHSYGINLGNKSNCTFSGEGLEHRFGTITVTATSNGDNDTANAFSCDRIVFDGTLSGTITATCKTGDAYGLNIGSVATITNNAEQAITSNITVTAKNAYAVYLRNTDKETKNVLSFENSKLTAKTSDKISGRAYAVYEQDYSAGKVRNIEFVDSTIVGDIKLSSGAGLIDIVSSKITGNVDMGDGEDTIRIDSGSQIKGDVSNLELFDMQIYSGVSKNLAMWEGEEFDDSAKLKLSCLGTDLDKIKTGKSEKFVLMKDLDNSSVEWTNATTLDLYLDGVKEKTLTYNGAAVEVDGFSFKLDGIEKSKTTTMQLTVTKLA